MAGPVSSGTFFFRSEAQFLIARASFKKNHTHLEETSAQSSTLPETRRSSSGIAPLPKNLPYEIWSLIVRSCLATGNSSNLLVTCKAFFQMHCEVMLGFQPSSVKNNAELPYPLEDTVKLLKLPYSSRIHRLFDSTKPEYTSQNNRLARELISQGCFTSLRGNFAEILNWLLSNNNGLTLQNLINMEFLDPKKLVGVEELAGVENFAGAGLNARLSREHTARFRNNLVALCIQPPSSNMFEFLQIQPKEILLGICQASNEQSRALMITSKVFNNSYNEIGEPLNLKHPLDTKYGLYLPYPAYSQHVLSWAVNNNRWEQVNELLKDGVSIDVRSWNRGTALHEMARKGDLAKCLFLLRNGASAKVPDDKGYTPFLIAVKEHDLVFTTNFLEAYGKIANSSSELPPIHMLLQQQASKSGDYALEIAAQNNDIDTARYLLDRYKEIASTDQNNFQQKSKNRALRYAVKMHNFEMLDVLRKAGAQLNHQWKPTGQPLQTLLHIAVKSGNLDMLELLHNALGALFNTHRASLLDLAAFVGDLPIWDYVARRNQDQLIATNSADKARVLAIKEGLLKTAVSGFSADVINDWSKKDKTLASLITHKGTKDTFTLLHRTIEKGMQAKEETERLVNTVRVLLELGAKIDVLHGEWSPLIRASAIGLSKIVKLFTTDEKNLYTSSDQAHKRKHIMLALHKAVEYEQFSTFDILVKSPDFDRSWNEDNCELLLKLCSPKDDETEDNEDSSRLEPSDLYSQYYEMAHGLAEQLPGGKLSARAWAEDEGYSYIVEILRDDTSSTISLTDPSSDDGQDSD